MPFSWDGFLEAALDVGISAQEFWELTMKETYMAIQAAVNRHERARKAAIESAWYAAAFSRMKELPKLSSIFGTKGEAESRAKESAKLFAESQEKYDVIG